MKRIYHAVLSAVLLISFSQNCAWSQTIKPDAAKQTGYFSEKGAYTGAPADVVGTSNKVVEGTITNAAVIEPSVPAPAGPEVRPINLIVNPFDLIPSWRTPLLGRPRF